MSAFSSIESCIVSILSIKKLFNRSGRDVGSDTVGRGGEPEAPRSLLKI